MGSAIPIRICRVSSPSFPIGHAAGCWTWRLHSSPTERYHQYQPLTGFGNHDIGGGFNDDPLWLVLAVAAYLKETGDWPILDQPVPVRQHARSEAPLYTHLQRSMRVRVRRAWGRTACR